MRNAIYPDQKIAELMTEIARLSGIIRDTGITLGDVDRARQIVALRARIAAALTVLNTAPDPASDGATKREANAIRAANQAAWAVLNEGLEPVQRRMGDLG